MLCDLDGIFTMGISGFREFLGCFFSERRSLDLDSGHWKFVFIFPCVLGMSNAHKSAFFMIVLVRNIILMYFQEFYFVDSTSVHRMVAMPPKGLLRRRYVLGAWPRLSGWSATNTWSWWAEGRTSERKFKTERKPKFKFWLDVMSHISDIVGP